MVPATMNIRIFLTLMMVLVLTGCGNAAGGKSGKAQDLKKGVRTGMKTYHMGRFAIDVPAEFKLEVQQHEFRLVKIQEFAWSRGQDTSRQREQRWHARLAEIEKQRKPKGVQNIIIKEEQFSGIGQWARGVLYFHDHMTTRRGCWEIWADYGDQLTVFKLNGLIDAQDKMLSWIADVARAYHSGTNKQGVSCPYFTERGVVDLPYKRQESTYARFEGHPMLNKLEITMNETHEAEPKKDGLLGRLTASILTGFASGVDIGKIRTGNRTVAGMDGEETILRMDDGTTKRLNFIWRYSGDKDSGIRPKIVFDMESEFGQEAEKIRLWDTMLDSMTAQ